MFALALFGLAVQKKDRKIYPLNLSILQQITVNGVNFCTAYVFGRLDYRSLVFSILWLSPKIIAFHPKVASLKWKERKERSVVLKIWVSNIVILGVRLKVNAL